MTKADVVIIGAGVMGLSTAYHLAKKGCRNVVVLEKASLPGSGSTGKNAGGIRHQFSSRVNIELSKVSFGMFRNFEEEMDQVIDLNHCGYLFLFDNEQSLKYFRKSIDLQKSMGVKTELLSLDEIEVLVPEFNLDGIIGGSFSPGDGLVDPAGVVNGYAGQAQRLGVSIRCDSPVTDIVTDQNRITGVSVNDEFISSPSVLIAAGPWTGILGQLAGLEMPVEPLRRQLAITRTAEKIRRDFPFVIDYSRSLYFHIEGGGILTGMSNQEEKTGFHQTIDEEWKQIHFDAAINRLPLLAEAELINEWAGLYEMTPDCQPILGAVEQLSGLYVCAGFSGHGFMHGPACGLLMAEEIIEGTASTVDIDDLRFNRFSKKKIVSELNVV